MATEKKKDSMLAKIESREDALKAVTDCGNAFFFLAALQGGIGAFIAPALIVDAAIIALCGYFVRYKHSRIAAVVSLLLSMLVVVSTTLNVTGNKVGGGGNLILALIFVAAAARATDATFKLHGRFKDASVAPADRA